jgi:hypothetical protein
MTLKTAAELEKLKAIGLIVAQGLAGHGPSPWSRV